MSKRIEQPKILGVNDVFLWWCKQKKKSRRHLRIKNERSHSQDTVLLSNNGDEKAWLKEHIEVLKTQIDRIKAQEANKSYFTKNLERMYEMKAELVEAKKRLINMDDADLEAEQVIMTDRKFKKIIYEYNKRAVKQLVDGKVINMNQYLGFLYITKIPRNDPRFKMKGGAMVNWVESYKYRDELIAKGETPKSKEHPEGKNWLVYYTDDFFLKYAWTKKSGACRVKNHGFYGFYPAKGSKKLLAKSNEENKLLHKKYVAKKIYYPRLKKDAA